LSIKVERFGVSSARLDNESNPLPKLLLDN
jgi:hypothetical protein